MTSIDKKKAKKLKIKQRSKRGFADEDTWSFDTYLASVIAGGVRVLQERSFGYPAGLTEEEWQNILDTIANGFEYYVEHKFEFDDAFDEPDNQFEVAFKLFHDYFGHLWD